jgi:hypothetical protein
VTHIGVSWQCHFKIKTFRHSFHLFVMYEASKRQVDSTPRNKNGLCITCGPGEPGNPFNHPVRGQSQVIHSTWTKFLTAVMDDETQLLMRINYFCQCRDAIIIACEYLANWTFLQKTLIWHIFCYFLWQSTQIFSQFREHFYLRRERVNNFSWTWLRSFS